MPEPELVTRHMGAVLWWQQNREKVEPVLLHQPPLLRVYLSTSGGDGVDSFLCSICQTFLVLHSAGEKSYLGFPYI